MKSLLFLYTGEAKYLIANVKAFEMLQDTPLDMPECDKRSVQEDVEEDVWGAEHDCKSEECNTCAELEDLP